MFVAGELLSVGGLLFAVWSLFVIWFTPVDWVTFGAFTFSFGLHIAC